MTALHLPDWLKTSRTWLPIGGLLLLILLMVGLGVTGSTLAQPLGIALLLLVPPNALMLYLKIQRPELDRRQFAMLSSVCFFLWLTTVILTLLILSWWR